MNIAFAGTPEFAVASLDAIYRFTKQQPTIKLVGVFCPPDQPKGRGKKTSACAVKRYATSHQLSLFQAPKISHQVLHRLQVDLLVVVAFGQLLPETILSIPHYGCWNVHASLLPRWRGAAPIQRAIEARDSQTGITIMQINTGLDTGPIISQKTTPILSKNAEQLESELAQMGATELIQQIQNIAHIKARPQIDHQASYAAKISTQERVLNWHQPAESILAKIRAFCIWPICQVTCQPTQRVQAAPLELKILQAELYSKPMNRPVGRLFNQKQNLLISCSDGVISLKRIKPAAKQPMQAADFINGYRAYLLP